MDTQSWLEAYVRCNFVVVIGRVTFSDSCSNPVQYAHVCVELYLQKRSYVETKNPRKETTFQHKTHLHTHIHTHTHSLSFISVSCSESFAKCRQNRFQLIPNVNGFVRAAVCTCQKLSHKQLTISRTLASKRARVHACVYALHKPHTLWIPSRTV